MKKFEDSVFLGNKNEIIAVYPMDFKRELAELNEALEKDSENYHRMERASIVESYNVFLD